MLAYCMYNGGLYGLAGAGRAFGGCLVGVRLCGLAWVRQAFRGCRAVLLGNGSLEFCDFFHESQFLKILRFGIWP